MSGGWTNVRLRVTPFPPATENMGSKRQGLAENCLSGLEQPAAITGRSLIVE